MRGAAKKSTNITVQSFDTVKQFSDFMENNPKTVLTVTFFGDQKNEFQRVMEKARKEMVAAGFNPKLNIVCCQRPDSVSYAYATYLGFKCKETGPLPSEDHAQIALIKRLCRFDASAP